MNAHAEGHDHVGHVVPLKLLGGVLIALLILTYVTVAASWIDLGGFNIWLALAIACVKATLVVLFFMHLRWSQPVNSMVFLISLLLFVLFVGFALLDTKEYQEVLKPGFAPLIDNR